MMSLRRFPLVGALLWLCWAPPLATAEQAPELAAAEEIEPAAQRLDALFHTTFQARLDHDPSLANRVGDGRSVGRMTVDLSEAYRARSREIYQRAARDARAIPLDELDARRRTWAEAFRWLVDMQLELLDRPLHLLPLIPGADFPSEFAGVAAGDADLAMDSAEDLRAYASRANDLVRWVDQAIDNLRRGAERGFVHPKLVVAREIQAIAGMVGGPLGDTVFQRPLETAEGLGLPPDQLQALREELETATRTLVVPAYARFHAFLTREYLTTARDDLGLGELDGGAELYRSLVRYFTTTELGPEEVFALGESESRRRKRSLRVQQRLAAEATSRFTRDDDQVLATFRSLEESVGQRLDRLFLHRPEAPLAVRFVEPHMTSLGGAFYRGPTPGDPRPGTFFLQPGGFDLANAEVLFLHEAIPGHHYQIALAQELEDVPDFLRYGYFGAFVEGWALYAESLGEELGLYRDPTSRVGRERFALGRAGRLVGDVGIHHFGWDLEEARSQLGRRQLDWARGEIGRYTTIPGQALAYTIGERKISELRTRAEESLGSAFDIRAFHEAVLDDGPLPLIALEAKIERWIQSEMAATP
ncbi:MAG: DUF885 domain-containing protein [Thermoanaerobaculia bacterium]|nr:DUF885 domain-containing protein [Thermoanaerobaculia bacterium]